MNDHVNPHWTCMAELSERDGAEANTVKDPNRSSLSATSKWTTRPLTPPFSTPNLQRTPADDEDNTSGEYAGMHFDCPQTPLVNSDYGYEGSEIYFAIPFEDWRQSEDENIGQDWRDCIPFRQLEELLLEGNITTMQMAHYHAVIFKLQKALNQTRDNEFQLIRQTKDYRQTIEKQNAIISTSEDFPENTSTEPLHLRENYLTAKNGICLLEDNLEKDETQIRLLKAERLALVRQLIHLSEDVEEIDENIISTVTADGLKKVEQRTKTLKKQNLDLKSELDGIKTSGKRYSNQLQFSKKNLTDLQEELNELHKTELELILSKDDPINELIDIMKKTEQLHSEIPTYQKEVQDTKVVIDHLRIEKHKLVSYNNDLEELQNSLQNTLMENCVLKIELESQNCKFNNKLTETQNITDTAQIDEECLNQELQQMIGLRDDLKSDLQELTAEQQKALDRITIRNNQLDQQMTRNDESRFLLMAINGQHKEMSGGTDTYLIDRQNELLDEIEEKRKAIQVNNDIWDTEKSEITLITSQIREHINTLNGLRQTLIEQGRMLVCLQKERTKHYAHCLQLNFNRQRLVDDVKKLDLQLPGFGKHQRSMQERLGASAKQYVSMKSERNRLVGQLNNATLEAKLLKEKCQLSANELEILKFKTDHLFKATQDAKKNVALSMARRDAMSVDLSNKAAILYDQGVKRDCLKSDIRCLNRKVQFIELLMVQLKKHIQRVEKQRSVATVNLIERQEEVYILKGKLNIQLEITDFSETEQRFLIDEMDFLRLQRADECRTMKTLKKLKPEKASLLATIADLHSKLALTSNYTCTLLKQTLNPAHPGRLYYLPLKPESENRKKLTEKINRMDQVLLLKENLLVEKNLLYESVVRIISDLQRKVTVNQNHSILLGQIVGDKRKALDTVTKKIRASIAECAVERAIAEDLRHQVDYKRGQITKFEKELENRRKCLLTPQVVRLPNIINNKNKNNDTNADAGADVNVNALSITTFTVTTVNHRKAGKPKLRLDSLYYAATKSTTIRAKV